MALLTAIQCNQVRSKTSGREIYTTLQTNADRLFALTQSWLALPNRDIILHDTDTSPRVVASRENQVIVYDANGRLYLYQETGLPVSVEEPVSHQQRHALYKFRKDYYIAERLANGTLNYRTTSKVEGVLTTTNSQVFLNREVSPAVSDIRG